MAVEVVAGSELAQRLQDIIAPKLIEIGWSSGSADDTLAEYVVLMLQSGKTQDEIAVDLSTDLLDLGPDDSSAREFARWLFDQINSLNKQLNGASADVQSVVNDQGDFAMGQDAAMAHDSDVGDTSTSQKSIPTGPKAMRNGSGGRGGNRMFNQLSRQMDRSSDSLHRVQGAGAGSGRINSHSGRGAGRGNKAQQIQRNFDGANRRAMNSQTNNNNMMNPAAGMQQQMQFMQMMEDHARLMTQMASQHGFMNPNFPAEGQGSNNTSKFDRNNRPQNRNRKQHKQAPPKDDDTAMGGEEAAAEGSEEPKDPAKTMCHFNLYCTKADCPYAHQTSAAPPGVTVDMDSECSFGVACKNFKCVSRHPSPAKKFEHQAQQECKFGPYCQNAKCQFKHSNAKPCRNGGDCTTEGCPFFHSAIECKFNPCTNAHCQYKHKDGQKKKTQNSWTPNEDGQGHISERKFVADDTQQEEEVIIPQQQNAEAEAMATI